MTFVLEHWIDTQLKDRWKRIKLWDEFKYVLLPDNNLIFDFASESHGSMQSYGSLMRKAEYCGRDLTEYAERGLGGGFVKIIEPKENADSENYKLYFFGASTDLGRPKKEDLERALSEGLSTKYSYKIG